MRVNFRFENCLQIDDECFYFLSDAVQFLYSFESSIKSSPDFESVLECVVKHRVYEILKSLYVRSGLRDFGVEKSHSFAFIESASRSFSTLLKIRCE